MKNSLEKQLKKLASTEEGRFEIYKIIHEQVLTEYNEQTDIGNVYNGYIEFLMSQPAVIDLVKEGNNNHIEMLKKGLNESCSEALKYIKNEKLNI